MNIVAVTLHVCPTVVSPHYCSFPGNHLFKTQFRRTCCGIDRIDTHKGQMSVAQHSGPHTGNIFTGNYALHALLTALIQVLCL